MKECPECHSTNTKKNGSIANGKPKRACNDCGRQYVLNPEDHFIDDEIWEMVERMYLEGVSIRAIHRITGIARSWLHVKINRFVEQIDEEIEPPEDLDSKKKRLILQCDEMWSFVGSKDNTVWIWSAMDLETWRIVAVHIGGREDADAQAFVEKIPDIYLKHACIDTDGLRSYKTHFASMDHTAWKKGSGMTSHIERFHLTMRTRVARLQRKSLCFSKKLSHHKAFIINFIQHYNEHFAPKIAA